MSLLRHALVLVSASLLFSSCCIFTAKPPVYPTVLLEGGVLIQDLVIPETGQPIRSGDRVTIDYSMRLEDGTEVDSTLETGEPISFDVGAGEVPRGLDLGIVGMLCFGRRRMVLPPEMAYGEEGRSPRIPGNAVVELDVEVIEVGAAAP